MKYWNKRRGRSKWTVVKLRAGYQVNRRLKKWCQNHSSRGRFHCHTRNLKLETTDIGRVSWFMKWEFELPEDAMAFKLTHG